MVGWGGSGREGKGRRTEVKGRIGVFVHKTRHTKATDGQRAAFGTSG